MNKLKLFLFVAGLSLLAPLSVNAHGLATTQNQVKDNYFIEFEYDTIGDVAAGEFIAYGFELLDPSTKEPIDFDAAFIRITEKDKGSILTGNLYPIEGFGRKGARISTVMPDVGAYTVEVSYYKNKEKQAGSIFESANKLTEATFDFNVSPPFELNSKKTPSYSTYLWAVTLVVGFIAGMAVRRSGKKDEGKTETK
jgi:hypothetical protein